MALSGKRANTTSRSRTGSGATASTRSQGARAGPGKGQRGSAGQQTATAQAGNGGMPAAGKRQPATSTIMRQFGTLAAKARNDPDFQEGFAKAGGPGGGVQGGTSTTA